MDEAIRLAEETVKGFQDLYKTRWHAMMKRKLGLVGDREDDAALMESLLDWMRARGADYTNTFRALADGGIVSEDPTYRDWHDRWIARRGDDPAAPDEARALMQAANPVYIPRNHRVEAALSAAEAGDLAPLKALLAVLETPYEAHPGWESYSAPDPAGPAAYRTFCGT